MQAVKGASDADAPAGAEPVRGLAVPVLAIVALPFLCATRWGERPLGQLMATHGQQASCGALCIQPVEKGLRIRRGCKQEGVQIW